ncbi:MAG: hypothetical protein EOO20_27325, partial [Chryseobacterium sp.]
MKTQKVELTDDDLAFIHNIYKPKIHGNLLTVAIIWIAIVPIAPFYKHRGISKSLYEQSSYGEALLWSAFALIIGWILMFYLFKKNLNKDLNSKQKIKILAEIKRKDWKNNNKFKPFFDDKKLDLLNITMDKSDYYTCFKGDFIEIEYLNFSQYLI